MTINRFFAATLLAVPAAGALFATSVSAQRPGQDSIRLADIDRDRDGTISRREWMAAFDQQDQNGDGVLSRREMDGNGPAPSAGRGEPRVRTFDVDPRAPWVFSGFTVERGDTLVVTVEGSVQLSEDSGDSATAAGSERGRRANGAPMPRELAGALIARIGNNGRPFAVGDQIQIIAPASGDLFLGVNDDFLNDNRGRFRVRIAVR
jgi:hypothetical protein